MAVEDVEGVEHHGEVVVHLRCAALGRLRGWDAMRCGAMRCDAMGWAEESLGGLDWAGGAGLAPGIRAEEVVWRGERQAGQAGRQAAGQTQTRQTDRRRPKLGRPPARLLRTTLKNWGPRAAPGLLATLLLTYDRTTGVAPAIACSLFFPFHSINSLSSFRVVARPARDTYIYLHTSIHTYKHTYIHT